MFSTLQKGLEIFGFFKIVCNGEGHCNTNVRKEHIFYAPRFSSTFAHNEFTYMLKILHKSEKNKNIQYYIFCSKFCGNVYQSL